MAVIGRWLLGIAVAFDRLLNAVLLGSSDETLSSRAYRAWRDGRRPGVWLKPVIDALAFWQEAHCEQSFLYERDRARLEAMPK